MNKTKLKRVLAEETGCTIQHNGWTCGSCFYPLADELNFNEWDYNTDIFPELINELYNKIK